MSDIGQKAHLSSVQIWTKHGFCPTSDRRISKDIPVLSYIVRHGSLPASGQLGPACGGQTVTDDDTTTPREGEQGDDTIKFFVPIIPPTATAQQKQFVKRGAKTIAYDPPALKEARAKLQAHLPPAEKQKPKGQAIQVVQKWIWPSPKTYPPGTHYRTTRPDVDNLAKALIDCMTKAGYWCDDAQISSLVVEKFYSDTAPPGIFVQISTLTEGHNNQ